MLGPLAENPAAASHAYLLYGPPGTGKRAAARALAVSLLRGGARSPQTVAERVARDAHPDLTWVSPSGASEMLVADIERPVVAAAVRTPVRVVPAGVRDRVGGGDERRRPSACSPEHRGAAQFVHLVLLSDRLDDVF